MTKVTTLIFILIFTLCSFNLNAQTEVKNEDKPLKGEWNFQPEKVWETENAGDDILVNVRNIRIDDDGTVYLFDRKSFKFFVFSPEGKYLYSFGKRGEGPGEYKTAFTFFLVGKYITIPDMGKIHFFTKDGKFVKSFTITSYTMRPRAFIDGNRFIIIQSGDEEKRKFDRLEIFDINTKERTTITEIIAEKSLTAVSSGGGMVLKLSDPNTTPMIIPVLDNNELYFGKNDKYLIKKMDLKGKEKLSFSIQGRERKKISTEVKKKRIDRIRINNAKVPQEMADQLIKNMPDQCTYFGSIVIDEKGLIYVYVTDISNETGQELDIFSPQGKYMYHSNLQLPEGLKKHSSLYIKGDYMYVFAEDEEGDGKLIKFKIEKPS